MGKIFYSADLHLGHYNIIKHSNRPFRSVEEMDKKLIENHNSVVSNDDDVYFIGDLCYKSNDPIKYLKQLNGKKHLIIGNHDGSITKNPVARKMFVEIEHYKEILDNNRRVILFHYPIAEWNGYFRKSYHIYGHVHNNFENPVFAYMDSLNNCFNAGVDLNNFMPMTLDDFIKKGNTNE